jgi:hypothetical protein
MRNLIIVIAFLAGFVNAKNPNNITGKWVVDRVDVSEISAKLTKQQKEVMNSKLVRPLANAVFDFKADHHFLLLPGLPGMPKNDYWEYDDKNAVITITEYNDHKDVLMKINIIRKDGSTFFALAESAVILKVHKQ